MGRGGAGRGRAGQGRAGEKSRGVGLERAGQGSFKMLMEVKRIL